MNAHIPHYSGPRNYCLDINNCFDELMGDIPQKELINLGSAPNAGDGDEIPMALWKILANLSYLSDSRHKCRLVLASDYDALVAELADARAFYQKERADFARVVEEYRSGEQFAELISMANEAFKERNAFQDVLRKIADDDDCGGMLYQDVAAIALGCTCTDGDRQKLMSSPTCQFHHP